MKKILLFLSILLTSISYAAAQEWFTNFDIAKRMALIQDKMLFVIWEESLLESYPVRYELNGGDFIILDLSRENTLDHIIWEHFIPVLLPESEYDSLLEASKERIPKYKAKLNDDSIKIMDINMNILNVNRSSHSEFNYQQDLTLLIKNYALKTTFIKQDLLNYSKRKNLTTSFNLGSKYIDLALFVEQQARIDIIGLAQIYFDEASNNLVKGQIDNKNAYSQRIELLKIKGNLILNNIKKARRLLNKFKIDELYKINNQLYSFLKYTTFMLLKDQYKASLYREGISGVNLKKAELILKINSD